MLDEDGRLGSTARRTPDFWLRSYFDSKPVRANVSDYCAEEELARKSGGDCSRGLRRRRQLTLSLEQVSVRRTFVDSYDPAWRTELAVRTAFSRELLDERHGIYKTTVCI